MDELGLFQLENLARTPTRFAFYDLRDKRVSLPPQLQMILQKATPCTPDEAFKALVSADKEAPVVLICESGVTSLDLAHRLEQVGFTNVYIAAGGVDGLLLES